MLIAAVALVTVLPALCEEPLFRGVIQGSLESRWGGPAAVLEDVLDEYVSLEGARRDYGVVIDEAGMTVDEQATRTLREQIAAERKARQRQEERPVRYLSEEWQKLCQDALNEDDGFAGLACDLSMELNNIIENCPDGKTRFLYWRFENGKLRVTVVGLPEDLGGRTPFFTTIASYDTFMKINTAKTSVEAAVMEGLLRFEGDLVRMMRHADALNRFTEVRRKIPTEY